MRMNYEFKGVIYKKLFGIPSFAIGIKRGKKLTIEHIENCFIDI